MSVEEAMNRLGISRTAIYRLVNERKLPAKKIGRRTMFTYEAVANYIDQLDDYEGGRNVF